MSENMYVCVHVRVLNFIVFSSFVNHVLTPYRSSQVSKPQVLA